MTETRRLLNINVESVNARYYDCNYTLLQKATIRGCSKIVKELLRYNADINVQNTYGWTALSLASFDDNKIPIIKELLNHHADVNLKDGRGETALMNACYSGAHKIVKELLSHHADINIQKCDGSTTLMVATKNKHTQIVMELLNHNADVNLQDNNGNTGLHLVLLEKVNDTTINIVKLLLSDFTHSEKLNKKNESVIHLAKES